LEGAPEGRERVIIANNNTINRTTSIATTSHYKSRTLPYNLTGFPYRKKVVKSVALWRIVVYLGLLTAIFNHDL
jgi:hypothetical protein